MLCNLVNQYEDITKLQKKAIENQDLDLLNNLIEEKDKIIDQMNDYLDGKDNVNFELRETITKVMQLETENINNLKTNQQEIRKQIDLMKQRKQGFNSYKKNIINE